MVWDLAAGIPVPCAKLFWFQQDSTKSGGLRMINARSHPSGSVVCGSRQRGERSWGDTAVLKSVFQVTVLSGQQKSYNVNGAKADLVAGHEYLSSVFLLWTSFCILTELSLHTFSEDLLGKNPKCALFCSTLGNEPKCRSEETFVSPSYWSFLPDLPCCTGPSPFLLGCGHPRHCPEIYFGAALWALVLLRAALEYLQLIISWRLWMVLDPWLVSQTLVLDPGADWWPRLPFPILLSL